MKLRQINIHECHQELLKIALVFDQICNKNNIPYYMLGGTMLGAIRHQGFIPWDDDMDFGIPREQYERFIEIATSELPQQYAILTYKNSPAIKKHFIKIQLKGSKLIEKVFEEEGIDFYNGISIDVFPLDGADINHISGKIHSKIAFLLQRIYEGRFCSLSIRKGIKKFIASLIKALPLNDYKIGCFIDNWIQNRSIEETGFIANYYGHWKEKEILPKSVFGEPIPYKFEDITLNGVSHPDEYLRTLYNNYMELPPIEQQITHADKIYVEGD